MKNSAFEDVIVLGVVDCVCAVAAREVQANAADSNSNFVFIMINIWFYIELFAINPIQVTM